MVMMLLELSRQEHFECECRHGVERGLGFLQVPIQHVR